MSNKDLGENLKKEAGAEKDKAVDDNGGKIEKSTEEIRREKWATVSDKIEHVTDRLGHPIDKKIKSTVIALNVFGINTRQSCGGHFGKRGAGTPWVDLESPGEPEERYNDQKKIISKIAEENGIAPEDLESEFEHHELLERAAYEYEKGAETKEFSAWIEENEKQGIIMESILGDFYSGRSALEDSKIRLKSKTGFGCFRMISGRESDYEKNLWKTHDKVGLKKRLVNYRQEFADFANFLKRKFFEQGESYIEAKRKFAQKEIDRRKIEKLRGQIKKEEFVDWQSFWKGEGRKSPARKDVFPNGEDEKMSDEEIVEALNGYFGKNEPELFNMAGIDSEEFPEIIDKDIRDLCVKLNKLPFLRTREGCGGHETFHSAGEINDCGYSSPYISFYIKMDDSRAFPFLKRMDDGLLALMNSDIPGVENMTFKFLDEPTNAFHVKMLTGRMNLVPTKEWCKKNNREYIENPERLDIYEDWCIKNGYEYTDDEESEAWKKWEETKESHRIKRENFEKAYSDYFRSEEARRIRNEFFRVFEKAAETQ